MMLLRGSDGSAVGFVKIVRDRTERWLSEQRHLALAKLGEGLANMVQPNAMATLASDLVHTALNGAAACYATLSETVSIDGFSISRHATVGEEQLTSACLQCLAIGVGLDGEALTATSSDLGAYCIIPLVESQRLVAAFVMLNDGERHCTADEKGFMREIATRLRFAIERRRAEEALRELAANLEKQVERRLSERNRLWANTRVLMAIMDPSGTIKEVNPAWKHVLGWEASELVGQSIYPMTNQTGRQILHEAWMARAAQQQFQIDVKSSDERLRQLDCSLSQEEDVGYLVGRDVTDQLEIEARLRQSQKMEAIGQLTGGLAHDFNNLLAGIIGSIDLLRLRIARRRYQDVERHIQAARTAAHRAAALTHRLLSFSRQQPIERKPVDMNHLVAGMEELLRRTLHVRIELSLELAATCSVMSDAHQMENAVLNLVINARDAMPGGGKITIATEDSVEEHTPQTIPINRSEPRARYACLRVTDTGAGIPEAVVSRVFEPFFTTKPAGQGTGLGLAMIYSFVKQMGGDVDLQTEQGKGTSVRLFFPCARRGDTDVAKAVPASYPKGGGERILVVEDDTAVRETIVEMLLELGYEPEGAEGSLVATERLRNGGRFDVLITDWGLPGLNGGELAELARNDRPELPICFVTGYNTGDAEIGTLRPNETLLTKPVGIDVLARIVARLLGRI